MVAATSGEIAPLVAKLSRSSDSGERLQHSIYINHYVDVLITGVGMVATAAWCARTLARATYDLALNFGVCGTFDRTLQPGTVVHVVADRLAELGAEDRDGFLTIQQLHLLGDDEFPFTRGELVNADPPANAALTRLPTVNGITVNTVHGNARSIAMAASDSRRASRHGGRRVHARASSTICRSHKCAPSRTSSRPRNRDAWKAGRRDPSLGETAIGILESA